MKTRKKKSTEEKKPRWMQTMKPGEFSPAIYDVGQKVKIHIKGPFVNLVFDTEDTEYLTIFFGAEPK